ncbi:MAG: DEAD/DEAH box helicase family protein, partial [Advenella sp.]
MSALSKILNSFRNQAISERDKGTDFEQLVRVYLRHEPFYKDIYENVWMYADWAELQGYLRKDTGIDLVAKTTTGEFHAIQCKNYAPEYKIAKADIDSFFTASGRRDFSHRVIVTTTNEWTNNALSALDNQNPPVSVINLADLERSQIDWEAYVVDEPVYSVADEPIRLKQQKTLREHQRSALESVTNGFKTKERGKLIMACGTGKTFTSLRMAEELCGPGKKVLFLVPSLALLSQTLTEWTQESHTLLHNFAVCSDSEVGKKRNQDDDRIQTTLSDLQYPATTNSERLAQQVALRHDATHMTVIYAT